MAVNACIILSFAKSVSIMAVVAVLLGVGAGMKFHLGILLGMTCNTCRFGLWFGLCEVNLKGMVGIVT